MRDKPALEATPPEGGPGGVHGIGQLPDPVRHPVPRGQPLEIRAERVERLAEVRHQYGPDVVMRAVVAVLQETPPERVHPVVGHRLEDRLLTVPLLLRGYLHVPPHAVLAGEETLGYIGLHGDHVQRTPALFPGGGGARLGGVLLHVAVGALDGGEAFLHRQVGEGGSGVSLHLGPLHAQPVRPCGHDEDEVITVALGVGAFPLGGPACLLQWRGHLPFLRPGSRLANLLLPSKG